MATNLASHFIGRLESRLHRSLLIDMSFFCRKIKSLNFEILEQTYYMYPIFLYQDNHHLFCFAFYLKKQVHHNDIFRLTLDFTYCKSSPYSHFINFSASNSAFLVNGIKFCIHMYLWGTYILGTLRVCLIIYSCR